MEFLVILVGFIALFLALNARKGVASLQLQLTGLLTRFSRLEDEIEDLRRAPAGPSGPGPVAPAPHRQLRWLRCCRGAPGGRDVPDHSRRLPPPAIGTGSLPAPAARRAPRWKSGWARAGPYGSAAWRWRSAACCWCATRSSRASSGPACAWRSARSSRSRSSPPANGSAAPSAGCPSRRSPPRTCRASSPPPAPSSAFGTVYAAHALYDFIGPAAAFVLLGIIGVATMLAAALHGPALAGLGLAGSLRGADARLLADAEPLAAGDLSRRRRRCGLRTCPLAPLAVARGRGGGGRVLLGSRAGGPGRRQHGRRLGVGAVRARRPAAGARGRRSLRSSRISATPDSDATPDWVATAALAALSVLAVFALGAGRFDTQWTMFAVVAMAILALTSWRSAPAAAAAALAGFVSLGAIAAWPGLKADPEPRLLAPAHGRGAAAARQRLAAS